MQKVLSSLWATTLSAHYLPSSTSTTTSTRLLIPYFCLYVITANAWVSFLYSQLVDVSLQPNLLLLLLEYQEGDSEESEQGPDRCTLLQEWSGVGEG